MERSSTGGRGRPKKAKTNPAGSDSKKSTRGWGGSHQENRLVRKTKRVKKWRRQDGGKGAGDNKDRAKKDLVSKVGGGNQKRNRTASSKLVQAKPEERLLVG